MAPLVTYKLIDLFYAKTDKSGSNDPYLINLAVMNVHSEHMVHFVDVFFANILHRIQ
jgi:hypothetical protein